MIEIENAVATPLEDLDLVIESFHKTTILSADKVVGNFLPPVAKQFQEILITLQITILNLLHPSPNFGLRLFLG